MKRIMLVIALAVCLPAAAAPERQVDALLERGRYLIRIAGCNDCHTAGYANQGGKVPEAQWLLGDSVGWRGDWGTTYPINLRLFMQGLTEAQWLSTARTAVARPPMPWFSLHAMSEADLRAIYRYVRHLGPAGKPAPAYVPPGKTPSGPYFQFPAPPK
ncbi:MAG: cytochrome C [Steroidobacteraceae bacterium]